MELLALLAGELWWVTPAAVAGGAGAVFGVNRLRRNSARRIGYEAARTELVEARRTAMTRRAQAKAARAELGKSIAERAASGAPSSAVAIARRRVKQADRALKSADAEVKAARARLTVARHELAAATDAADYPLARVIARHEAVTARWMEYETDPAKLIAYPTLSDVRDPATKAFHDAAERARWLRPEDGKKITPTEFIRYRDAVAATELAFDHAEETAKRRANAGEGAASDPQVLRWQEAAQDMLERGAQVIDRAAEAFSAWNRNKNEK